MKTNRRGEVVTGALLSMAVLWSSASRAHGLEDQYSIDAASGAGLAVSASVTGAELGVEAGSSVGLGPSLVLRGSLGASAWNAHGAPAHFGGRLHTELLYAFDILRVVPALGIGASLEGLAGTVSRGDRGFAVLGGPHIVASFDFLLTRRTSAALDLRARVLFGAELAFVAPEARLRLSWLFDT